MSVINIKQHDTKGKFIDTLTLDGGFIDLTGATVRFVLEKPGIEIKKVAVITAPLLGAVEYQLVAADVQEYGKYKQEWEITFPDTTILTVPNGEYNTVNILRDLG